MRQYDYSRDKEEQEVTSNELKSIFYLDRELKMWQEELQRIIDEARPKAQPLTGMPHGNAITNPTFDAAVELGETTTIINGIIAKINVEKKKIYKYIASVDDSYIRQIIELRNVQLLPWAAIAARLNTSEYSVKKTYYRYIKKDNETKLSPKSQS